MSTDPPGYGYQVPPSFGPPPPGAGGGEYDQLVPPPRTGLAPLYERLTAALWRSWRILGVIVLLTFALPQVVQSLLTVALGFGVGLGAIDFSGDDVSVGAGSLALAGLLALLLQVAVLFINAIGWGAGIWAVTREAAGQPATVGDALRAGLRRSGPMFGWYLLFWLMVVGGLIACILPGIYLFVAGSLFGFVVMYEHRGGIGRSFGLVNRQLGAALGRVLLLLLAYLVGTLVVGCLVGAITGAAAFGLSGGESVETITGLEVVGAVVEAAAAVPLTMLLLVGLLLTYTQLRAAEEQITTGHLLAAVDSDGAGPPGYPGRLAPPSSPG